MVVSVKTESEFFFVFFFLSRHADGNVVGKEGKWRVKRGHGNRGTGLIKRTKGLTPDTRGAVTDHVMKLSHGSERGGMCERQEV